MALSRRVKKSIEKGPQYHAILEVLRVAFEQGYESREVPAIIAEVGPRFAPDGMRGILSHTDIGILVRFLMGNPTYHHISDDLTNLASAGYSRHFPLSGRLSEELVALTTLSDRRKAYYAITPSGIEFSTSRPFDPSSSLDVMKVYFRRKLAPAENHKI